MKYILPWLLLLLVLPTPAFGAQRSEPQISGRQQQLTDDANSSVEINRLIRELGAADFIRREQAQERLLEIGLPAFDALATAQDDPDLEIAERARFLLHSLQVRWADEEDAPEVRNAVRNYESATVSERRSLIDRLGGFPSHLSATTLARIARFERESHLSKRAALAVMNQKPPEDAGERRQLGKRLASLVGNSDRKAAAWLMCFADQLQNPQEEGLDRRWSEIILNERRQLATLSEPATEETVRDLMRWRARDLADSGKKDEARQALVDLLELVDDSPDKVLSAADWYLSVQAWDMVGQMKDRYATAFDRSLLLQYRYAEALLRDGREQQAAQVVEAARAERPQADDEHLLAAESLQDRGFPDWAQAELLQIMQRRQETEIPHLKARLMLAELLHDAWRELEAAQTLQKVVDVAEQDPAADLNLKAARRSLESVKARMYLFYANHYGDQQDREKQKEYLVKGMADEYLEIDLIIAQFRFQDDDPKWRDAVSARVRSTAEIYRSGISSFKQNINARAVPAQRIHWEYQLAVYCNQLAWLIANTEGDLDEALKSSEESLRLNPSNAGYLDTLGRCYYARKQYRLALTTQQRAVALDPGSQSMRRQLKLFEEAMAQEAGRQNEMP